MAPVRVRVPTGDLLQLFEVTVGVSRSVLLWQVSFFLSYWVGLDFNLSTPCTESAKLLELHFEDNEM